MHKAIRSVIVLVPLLILVTCGGKEREPVTKSGIVGSRVDLAVLEPDLNSNNQFEWQFVETPPQTHLSKYDFNPMFNRPQVSFVPPDSGIYTVAYTIQDPSGKPIATQQFFIQVAAKPGGGSMAETSPGEAMEGTTSTEPSSVPAKTPEKPAISSTKPRTTAPSSATSTSGNNRADLIPKIAGKYTVQIAALKNRSGAEKILQQLEDLGYDAYIQRAQFPDTGETWYRVRSGRFNSYDVASALASKMNAESQLGRLTIWVDFLRQDT